MSVVPDLVDQTLVANATLVRHIIGTGVCAGGYLDGYANGYCQTGANVIQTLTPFAPTIAPGSVTVAPNLVDQSFVTITPFLDPVIIPEVISQLITPFSPQFTFVIAPSLTAQLIGMGGGYLNGYVGGYGDSSVVLSFRGVIDVSGGHLAAALFRNPTYTPPVLVVVTLNHSSQIGFRNVETWERVSGTFAIPPDGKPDVLPAIVSTWLAYREADVVTTKAALNTALTNAGYTKLAGDPID